jgi:hypothetical protein
MEDQRYAVVITTINHPTHAVRSIQARSGELPSPFYVIGDSKSPPDFSLNGAHYFDLPAQYDTGFSFARLCPTKHYARKNVGYLAAIRDGANVIIETDDDNIPRDGFYLPRTREVTAPLVTQQGWCNVYRYFTDQLIWPRGLPLDRIREVPAAMATLAVETSDCPIQQGLADENPDVDAIYRLILPLPLDFEPGEVVLDRGVWCPFNSQNTTFWKPAFPLLYLPFYCSFRMTDIWRSFIAQRVAWENGWRLLFHGSTVYQERNEHDLMHDFRDEVPGYLHNERIRRTLEDLPLAGGVDRVGDDLLACYRALIGIGVVGVEEGALVAAWLEDLAKL